MKGFSGPKVCEQKADADAEAGDFYSPAELYADIPDLSRKSYTLQTLLTNLNKMLFWYKLLLFPHLIAKSYKFQHYFSLYITCYCA